MSRLVGRYIAIPMSIIINFSLIFLWANNSVAQQCKPLLIPNKKTLFQRVISHPGANLYISADKASPLVQTNLKPFTVFYIYERKYVG